MTTAAEVPNVAICVPTFQRPDDLSRLLSLLPATIAAAQRSGRAGRVDVIVIDNDPSAGARDVARAAPIACRYAVEAERGVVAVRNRALDESADADVLVFIDDDETPADEQWLSRLLSAWRTYDAQAVAGPVRTVADDPLDSWIVAGEFFARAHRARLGTGDGIARAATNNLLLDMRFVRREALRFDPRFARSGGEDSLFTSQLHRRGGRMVWCAEAGVLDHLPAQRRTREHALRRTRGMATVGVTVALALADSPAARARVRIKAVVAGVGRWAGGVARVIAGGLLRSERLDAIGRRECARGTGSLEGALNRSPELYGGGGDR
ncbi:glycosyltransferase family 2 protein [Microbacterium sp. CIAB417]|uniref:glycosyltransferase n=1 Tax=Microbacterium sp. CIAB417 TaxID=2860287 RepID=UPI001FACAAE9|nr:glycosyltransferase family 2 protein [Microbacterium sp. CIAB417]